MHDYEKTKTNWIVKTAMAISFYQIMMVLMSGFVFILKAFTHFVCE